MYVFLCVCVCVCVSQDYVRLDCLVTVVDAPRFHEDMRAAHTPATAAAASRLLSAALPEDMSTAATTAAPAAGAAVGPAGASTSHNVPEPRAVMSGDPNLIDAEDNRPLAELLAEQVRIKHIIKHILSPFRYPSTCTE